MKTDQDKTKNKPQFVEEKWKVDFIEMLNRLSNEEMLDTVIAERVADDWDGCFTTRQRWRADTSLATLKMRLTTAGWLA